MHAEIDALDEKIRQFVAWNQRLRAENQELRQKLTAAVSENKRLSEKVDGAVLRVESLLARLPEEG